MDEPVTYWAGRSLDDPDGFSTLDFPEALSFSLTYDLNLWAYAPQTDGARGEWIMLTKESHEA